MAGWYVPCGGTSCWVGRLRVTYEGCFVISPMSVAGSRRSWFPGGSPLIFHQVHPRLSGVPRGSVPLPPVHVRGARGEAEDAAALVAGALQHVRIYNARQVCLGSDPASPPGGHHGVTDVIAGVGGGTVPGG